MTSSDENSVSAAVTPFASHHLYLISPYLAQLFALLCLMFGAFEQAEEQQQEFQNSKLIGNSVFKFQYNLSCPYASVHIRISHFTNVLVGRTAGQFICSLTCRRPTDLEFSKIIFSSPKGFYVYDVV